MLADGMSWFAECYDGPMK